MQDFDETISKVNDAIMQHYMIVLVGEMNVEYDGRATSILPRGKRLILIKGDKSISIHQNKLVRPTNYMVNSKIFFKNTPNGLILHAKRSSPNESLKILLHTIEDVKIYEIAETNDLRLSGSERDLSNLLMQDLSIIEPGLKALNQEEVLRKGVVDILAEDAKGKLVVIEIKRRQADYACVTQLERYMKQVRKMKNKETRGILVAPEIRKTALELLERTGLEYYKLDFQLKGCGEEPVIEGIEKKQKTLTEIFKN